MPPPCAACGHQYCGKRYSIRDTHGSQGTCTENHCCRCDGYDGCDVCGRYYECCTCRAAAMPVVLRTLPGAWLQQTENGTAWSLSDDDVAEVTGAKGQRKVNTKSGGGGRLRRAAGKCRRDDGSATGDARRTIDEVALASQAELPADNERRGRPGGGGDSEGRGLGRLPPLCSKPRPGPQTDGRPPPCYRRGRKAEESRRRLRPFSSL